MHSCVNGLQSGHAASDFPTIAPDANSNTTPSTILTALLLMISLLELAPLAMTFVAAGVLVALRPGCHTGLLALLVFSGVSDGALRLWPSLWSVTSYVADSTVACILIAVAAIEAVNDLRDRRLIMFRMACLAASALVAGEIIAILFPPDTVRTMMVRLNFAAASVAGVAAGTRRLDPVDDAALRWLFVTRALICMRLPLIGTAAHGVLSGASTVAWAIACYLIVRHCLSPSSPDEPAARPA